MDHLEKRVALITGAASGIGRATAHALAAQGTRVVVADLDGDGAGTVASEINDAGGQAIAVQCDVGVDDAYVQLRDAALDAYGGVDILMNNVGVMTRGLPEHVPLEEWQRILNTNLLPVPRSIVTFLPLFLDQGHGHVVNTASFAGLFTYSYDRLPYVAAKAAIIQISEGLALYLRPKNIGVTVLCPGPVATNIAASMRSFGPETPTRGPGPQFPLLAPEVVGEQVRAAIENDTFMLYTDDQVRDVLVERASDWNAFIAKQVDSVASQ